MIRVCKSVIYKVIGRAKISYFDLITILSSIKDAINQRPLTYRDEEELKIVTPNSFLKLHGNSNLILRDSKENEIWLEDSDRDKLTKALEFQEEKFEEFKRLWYQTYLLNLRDYSRNLYQKNWENKIKVGDVVLVKLPNKPRPFWLLGRIMEVVISPDNNKIRTAKVRRGDGRVDYHSICHLYPLELSITHSGNQHKDTAVAGLSNQSASSNEATDSGDAPRDSPGSKRPVRQAAKKFRQFIQDNLENL